jgi:hypothetical protein
MSGKCSCFIPSVFALLPVHLGTLVTGEFARFWESRPLPTTSDALTKRFNSKLAGAGSTVVRQIGKYLTLTEG